MSARSRRRLTVDQAALLDIEDILLYTLEHWRKEQRRRYHARLKQAMRSLTDHPELGTPRDDVYPGCRGLVVASHVVFYRLTETEIVVGRVLHQNQDPTGKVKP